MTSAHADAVEEGPAEDGAFFAHQAGGGAGHRDALGRNHLAGDAAAGVGRHHEIGVNPDLLRRGLLQGGEQGVGGGVGAGEEDAQPAQEWARRTGNSTPVAVKASPRVELMPE